MSMVVIMIHLALGLEVFINSFTLLRDIEICPLIEKSEVKLEILNFYSYPSSSMPTLFIVLTY